MNQVGTIQISFHLFCVQPETGVKHTVQFTSLLCCFCSATSFFCVWELPVSISYMEANMFSASNAERYYIVET